MEGTMNLFVKGVATRECASHYKKKLKTSKPNSRQQVHFYSLCVMRFFIQHLHLKQ